MDAYNNPTPIATVEQFKAALLTVRDRIGITPKELALLQAHCRASKHTISTVKLAKELDYPNHRTVNMHYGALAHHVADALHHVPPPVPGGEAHWWRTLAYGNDEAPQTDDGHYEWIMRPELVQALQEMKWA
jgi:hypothetical protein